MNFWQKCSRFWIPLFSKKIVLYGLCFVVFWFVKSGLFCQEKEEISASDSIHIEVPEPWTGNWLYKKVYPLIFKVENEREQELDTYTGFEQYAGKQISNIFIVNLDVFDLLTNKSDKHIYNKILALGNQVHYKTRDWTLENMLFFAEGDMIDAEVMNRNLAYIKNLSYLREAEFLISENEDNTVDVFVLVRDKFSLELSGRIISTEKYRLKINEQNILGLGLGLKHIWHINPKEMKTLSWESYFKNANIKGTFWGADAYWLYYPGKQTRDLYFSHPFLYPATPHSGGLEIRDYDVHPPADTIASEKITLSSWYAHSFGYPNHLTNAYKYAALALERNWFPERPEVSENIGKPWHENIFALSSLAFSKTSYTALRNVNTYLVNNILPVGYLWENLLGYEWGEFRNRCFLGTHCSWADKYDNGSYLYLFSALETYLAQDGLEQSIIAVEPLYISPLQIYGSCRSRFFSNSNLIIGSKCLNREQMNVSSLSGYRGIWNLEGSKILRSSIENDLALPSQIWGFNIGLFAFLDCAFGATDLADISTKNILLTEGGGIKVNNPALIWDSIELCFALNQKKASKGEWKISLSTNRGIELPEFSGKKPQTYKFQ